LQRGLSGIMQKTFGNIFVTSCAFLCLCVAPLALTQENKEASESLPNGWHIYAKGDLTPSMVSCFNFSRANWRVLNEGKDLKIVEDTPETVELPPEFKLSAPGWRLARKHVLKFDGGWLVGIDAGEWGGGLWITNEAGSEAKNLVRENVKGIIPTARGILVFSGLAHLGMDFGDVLILSEPRSMRVNLEWSAHLDSEPVAFARQPDDSVLIATTHGVSLISPPRGPGQTDAVRRLFFLKQFRTYMFSVNSIAKAPDGSIYLGSRGLVVRIPEEYTEGGHLIVSKEEFLAPDDCRNLAAAQDQCVCGP
jgi:hypothetical protein